MDRAAAEAFLAEPRILVFTASRGGREPLVAPVWYEYGDGVIRIWTGAESAKAKAARRHPAVTACIQTETAPYKVVLVRGTATVQVGRDEALMQRIAIRYLGEAAGNTYVDNAFAGGPAENDAILAITPTAWRAWDYAEGGEGPWVADGEFR